MKSMLSDGRWAELADTYDAWWRGALDRPVFHVKIRRRAAPNAPACLCGYPLDAPMRGILRDQEALLRAYDYVGDSYPVCLPDFGAGVNAAFLGARPIVRPESVWFEADRPASAADLSLRHHADSPVYRRMVRFYREADAFFGGEAVLGMTHLNNGIDIPARFLGAEGLCLALRDEPAEVERLVWENHALFCLYLGELSALCRHNRGYTCWGDLFARTPWFGAQSDFSALIGPGDFDRFVLPELEACFRMMPEHNYYHLDGREQLVHLDRILAIPELQAVQWVAGADELPDAAWMGLYRRIRDAGKKLWYVGPLDNLGLLADALGDLRGVYWAATGEPEDEERLLRAMEAFGVPAHAEPTMQEEG